MTAESEILRVVPIDTTPKWMSVTEMKKGPEGIVDYSENHLASRTSDLERDGLLVGRVRSGAKYKEWARRSVPVQPKPKVPKGAGVPEAQVVAVSGKDHFFPEMSETILVTFELPKLDWDRAQRVHAIRFSANNRT